MRFKDEFAWKRKKERNQEVKREDNERNIEIQTDEKGYEVSN